MKRPIEILDSAVPMVIDGNRAQCFVINLHTAVLRMRVKNIAPGVLYTFVIHQDNIGNHSLAWSSTCRNATRVDPRPNATTVQNFIGITGGYLDANVPATW